MASIVMKRVMKEYKALVNEPLPGIVAVPREDDVTVWDVGILVEVPKMTPTLMHVGIQFTNDYPSKPPNAGFGVLFSSSEYGATDTIPTGPLSGMHSVCLNIVGNFQNYHSEWTTTKGEGWSPSMNASTLLVNIQYLIASSLLENPGQGPQLHSQCEQYLKSHKLSDDILELLKNTDKKSEGETTDDDCAMEVETEEEGPALESTVVDDSAELQRLDEEIACWYSCIHYTEGLLGFGIKIEPMGRKKTLRTDGEYISYDAYKDGLKQFADKESFDKFLPIWVNKKHSENNPLWLPAMMECLQSLQSSLETTDIIETAIFVFCDLINTMTVKMMDQSSDTKASLKIFSCIVNIWRCFYYLSYSIPQLRSTVRNKVVMFIEDDSTRRKDITPNVGWMLSMASILHKGSEFSWSDFVIAYEDETSLRKVMWWQKDNIPIEPNATYVASAIARKNSLFQRLFQSVVIGDNIEHTLTKLEKTSCRMIDVMDQMLHAWKEMEKQIDDPSASWMTHYELLVRFGMPKEYMDVKYGTNELIQSSLQQTVAKANTLQGYFHNSNRQTYHQKRGGSYDDRGGRGWDDRRDYHERNDNGRGRGGYNGGGGGGYNGGGGGYGGGYGGGGGYHHGGGRGYNNGGYNNDRGGGYYDDRGRGDRNHDDGYRRGGYGGGGYGGGGYQGGGYQGGRGGYRAGGW